MIGDFKCKLTRSLFVGETVPCFHSIASQALRKLDMLDAAESLEDLKAPPGNRLEALAGDRKGQYSIRINDRWRICFVWRNGSAWQVEIVDYQ